MNLTIRKMKKRPNINNRIIGRMLIIVIVISAAILGGYTFVQYHDILSRAQDSIRAYQQDAHFYLNEKANTMLFAYECYVGQNPKEYVMYFPEEDETVSYELDPYEIGRASCRERV